MAESTKKRSAEEGLDEELQSPSSRSRVMKAEEEEEGVATEAVMKEDPDEENTQEEDEGVKEEDSEQEEEQQQQQRQRQEESVEENDQQPQEEGEGDEEREDVELSMKEENHHDEENLEENDNTGSMEDQEEEEAGSDKNDTGNNDNDNDNEEEDEQMEEDKKRLLRPINAEGRPAEAGVIKTIVVENFMCHRKLKVELNRNINFISGLNGSGKSAILAAIQVCLGANARNTHRARKMSDLVRKEAAGNNPNTTAKVRVTLLNGGPDAYKPDEYGERITVERCISLRNGYNGYRLLDENDKEVSRKKFDLDDMLDYLNIQVDNPVAILGQEDAKKFLTGKATDKHQFFMKATELERIDRTFLGIIETADELDGKKARLEESLEVKKELSDTLKKKVDEFQAVEKLEKKRLDLEVDYSWAFFAERDEEFEQEMNAIEAYKKKLESKQLELSQAEEEASGASDQNEEGRIKDKMEELKNEAESQAQLKRNLEAELKLAQVPVKQLKGLIKNNQGEKKRADQNLRRAQKRLKDAREEMLAKAGSAESDSARRTAQLNETEEALTKAKAETDQIRENVAVAFRSYEELEPELQQAKEVASARERQYHAISSKLREMSSSEANDPIAVFGKKCSQMVKLVESARRKGTFRGKVIGPIGAFLKIAPGKDNYAGLAELALGQNTLDRFIVTNDHDRKEFDRLRGQLKCFKECGMFQVTVSDRFRIPPPPAQDIETVASVLVIENDVVFNCLVDNARIDQRALGPSKEITEDRLLVQDQGRYKIKGNINEVTFLPRGDKWTVRDGTISVTSNDKKFHGRKIGVDMSSAIKEKEAELKAAEAECKELKKARDDLAKKRHNMQRKWNEMNKAKRANEDTINELTRKKEEIENEMETTASTEIDTTEMEEDVSTAEEELTKIKEEYANLTKELDKMEPGVADVRGRLDEAKARNEKVLADMANAERDLQDCLTRQTQSEVELDKKRQKVQKYQDTLSQRESKCEELTEKRDQALAMARKLTLRQKRKEEQEESEGTPGQTDSQNMTQDLSEEALEQVEIRTVTKSSDAYDAKLKRIKTKITKEREKRDLSNEDPTVATEKWLKAKEDMLKTQMAVTETEKLLEDIAKDIRDRKKRWSKLLKYLKDMTDSRFDEILNLNKSSGQLEFDDETKELNLVVQKDINDPNSQTKDVKALSGGERSFTTISLLLALGESLETPFRVLDEFDVFLDPQARKLAIQTLIHIAKKLEHRQFIFITPQDLSSVKPDARVKIFKMKPPERNNQAGGPTQQILDFSQN